MRRFLWASYGMYLLAGSISVLFGSIMPELVVYYHTTYTTGGLLILSQSIGFIAGVLLTVNLMKKYHHKAILSGSALVVFVAQAGLLIWPPIYLLFPLMIVNGVGVSMIETAVASYIMELFAGRRAVVMSRLEVAFGLGALGMPVIASGLIAMGGWRFSSGPLAAFALTLSILWITMSVESEVSHHEGYSDARTAAPPAFSSRVALYQLMAFFLVLIFIYVGVEGSLNSFLPTIFTIYVNTKPYFATLSTTVFWIAMVVGRMAIGWIVHRISYERYLLGSFLLSVLFFLLLAQFHTSMWSYVIVGGLGFSMSAIYSVTMVYANHTFPGRERFVTSAVTGFAGMGMAVFPAVIGYAVSHLLPWQVLWLLLGFAIIMLAIFFAIEGNLRIIRKRTTY